ncbi:restriction endonuclease subunit S [Halomonas sp. EF61]|uniref:restriction endonuclease subunit S n=1 Tax=Halomonas sp. EF61 TaxID=2950869 RepID=UPI0032DE4A24
MTFPKYPEYKDSGVEWLGEVPAHWEKLKLSLISIEKCDGPFGSAIKSEHYRDNGVRVIRLQNIKKYFFNGEDAAYIDADYYRQQIAKSDVIGGDLLVAGLGDDNNAVGRACVAPYSIAPAMVKADCFRFRLDTKRAFPDFLAYQLSAGAEADAGLLSTGSTRSRIPLSTMGGRIVALPPSHEQVEVSAFLDYETARIDALVEEQQRLIELLKEKRQAVISHAVTKGLDPDVPMKDSGVEWLGEVPVHWEVAPLGLLSRQIQTGPFGSQLHSHEYVEGGVPVINPSNIVDGEILPDPSSTVTQEVVERLTHQRLSEGEVVVGRRGEMGRCAVVSSEESGWLCGTGSMKILLSERADPDFVSMFIRTPLVRGLLQIESVGSTMDNLNPEILSRIRVPVPPIEEQRDLVEKVRLTERKTQRLISEALQGSELLQERRSALISAAVTGKIDVRGWQPPEGSTASSEATQTEMV